MNPRNPTYIRQLIQGLLLLISLMTQSAAAVDMPASVGSLVENSCRDCHDGSSAEGGLDLTSLSFDLENRGVRQRWIHVFDRVVAGEMPPDSASLSVDDRNTFLNQLGDAITTVDRADVFQNGRGPMRRLNRNEYEQNLRDVLNLPQLDIRDMLPEDREEHRFNKSATALDMSHVQLTAYLDAVEVALRQAMASGAEPPSVTKYKATGSQLFPGNNTFGEREAMFFSIDNEAVDTKDLESHRNNPALELALFRSANWPYYGYPLGFVAELPGDYRVRFSARAVLQTEGYQIKPANNPVPMTFRARKPSGADVSGDVRATGGIIDIQPEQQVYEATVRLRPTETFEYSLLGLPVPLARNVNGGPPTYRYPPFPEGGQPGVAFQWLEVEGPIPPETWPPSSHRILFDTLENDVVSKNPVEDARRLLRRFVKIAEREPVSEEDVLQFEQLIMKRLEQGHPFSEAMLTGYQAFLCSSHFLYLREPSDPKTSDVEQYAIASRLSHFLTNSRPDQQLLKLAESGMLRDAEVLCSETDRLITSSGIDRFVQNFTDYWLNLKHIRRDEPDIRLHPEYRGDDYLIESMDRETRLFFKTMIQENLPSTALIDTDFVFVNDTLARHYGLPEVSGSHLQRFPVPDDSPYGGLLTQGAILKVTANGTSTSPVIRGAWIMERLLGQEPPPPPTSVPAIEPDIRGATTIRELLDLHTKSEQCATCHARFDPVGIALENFDILGGWRTHYRGLDEGEIVTGIDRAGHDYAYTICDPVDASGQLLDRRRFQNIHELKTILISNPRQLGSNLLHQFTLYATGTPIRFSDREEVELILDTCKENDYRVRDLIHELICSRIFLGKEGCR